MSFIKYPVSTSQSRHYKVFTKKQLEKANNLAVKRNYNRSVEKEFLNKLDDDALYPVTMSFVHEHAGGDRVNAHMRCWVGAIIGKQIEKFFIDVDMKLYDSLEIVAVPLQDGSES